MLASRIYESIASLMQKASLLMCDLLRVCNVQGTKVCNGHGIVIQTVVEENIVYFLHMAILSRARGLIAASDLRARTSGFADKERSSVLMCSALLAYICTFKGNAEYHAK